jgi:hypothetical protein
VIMKVIEIIQIIDHIAFTALPSRRWRRVRAVRTACDASRSRRDEHALCRPCDATPLPSWRWRRVRAVRLMCVPPATRRDRGGTSTCCAARATGQPSPAGAGGGCAPSGLCVHRRRRVAIASGRERTVPPARRTALPSRRWRRALAMRPMFVPTAARRDRGGTSSRCAARATRPPSQPPLAEAARRAAYVCTASPAACRDRGGTSMR